MCRKNIQEKNSNTTLNRVNLSNNKPRSLKFNQTKALIKSMKLKNKQRMYYKKIMKISIMFTNIHVAGLTLVVQMYIITDNYGIGFIGSIGGRRKGVLKLYKSRYKSSK